METIKTTKSGQREKFPDLLKGFAIILVVLGHCIQEGSGERFSTETLYFYDRLYQFLYSFHMPLFMMVSGYLCWGSIERADSGKKRLELIRRRAKSLLTPVFFWTAVEYIRNFALNPAVGAKGPLKIIFDYFYSVFNNLWFLWAVFWCFLIVFMMHCYFKDNVILYALGFLLMFFVPDGMCLGVYKYMLP
ncbi:MAG: acyltransferase family protein, partial [Lachnospiraceae bacterium]|nr:acyltransferase family protein [Lachnospiraceae bacterium]